jgi:transglutaminase-like putative cysteine protease
MKVQKHKLTLSVCLGALVFVLLIVNTYTLGGGIDTESDPPVELSVWELAQKVRPGSGGLEADRDTWVRDAKVFKREAVKGVQEWNIEVLGEARPVMRRLSIENLGNDVSSPFLLGNNYDFRSVPELVASITRNAKTDKEKALSIRELLIGEGFFFNYSVPKTNDPICRLTSSGYGFCGPHAQLFDQLAEAAGLRSRTCSHAFSYGHATNEVFYDGQWHFIDTNAESVIYKPDGNIPSYEDIGKTPNLVPSGDAYGQTSFGIDGARYARALYSAPTKCFERDPSSDTRYGTLDFPLRANESITWDWEDADFTRNRENNIPVFGKGRLEYKPRPAKLVQAGSGLSRRQQQIEVGSSAERGRLVIPVISPYPVLEAEFSGRISGSIDQVSVRVSKDNGDSWLPMEHSIIGGLSSWRFKMDEPEKWAYPMERAEYTDTIRTIVAGQYGYLLEISLKKEGNSSPSVSDLRLTSIFRHYPPALPFLKIGSNKIAYVDRGARKGRNVRVTMEWEERRRTPTLSTNAAEWGWGDSKEISTSGSRAELPTIAEGSGGVIHLVYSVGNEGSRRIAYSRYKDGAWSPERLITSGDKDANHPVVAEDGRGNIWVAYQTGGLWQGGDVYVLSIKDNQTSQPIRLNDNDPYHIAFFPSISAHGNKVTVSWEGGEPGVDLKNAWGTEVGWMRTHDGTSWEDPVFLKGDPFKNLGLPKVIYDDDGRLHLMATKGPRYYRRFPSADSKNKYQWLTPEWMYHSRGGSFYLDRQSNLWAVFDGQNSGTTNEIYCRMLTNGSPGVAITDWTKALRISEDDKRPSIYPNMVAESDKRLAVVWMDYRHKSVEVYAKVFNNGHWSPDLLISHGADQAARKEAERLTPNQLQSLPPQGRQSTYPNIALAGDGTVWAVWQEADGNVPGRVVARRLTWEGCN